ncbi:MAG: TldD/PmbA family protein [Candidatus Bathyarchaeota archaeon]|nr:TldD/PmbA family protein [Candidatus Bathyarchaeota archaeon A05DMB-3]MDH7606472.1 TldD/PmbA family protein [Candidatus Bathyarchaeota archaeon]
MAALKEEEIISLAEDAANFALRKGVSEAEVFVYEGLTTTVAIERGQIAKSSRIIDRGLGIRTVINNAVGFSYTNILENKAAIEETVLKSLKSAKASKPDKDWQGFPPKKPFAHVKNTFDSSICELSSEDLVKTASLMLEAAEKTDKRVFPVEGGIGASYLSRAVVNSNGIVGFDYGTIVECSLATVAQEAGEVTPVCFEFNVERLYKIDPEWVGMEAARQAASALKAKRVETKSMKVIFAHFALQQLLHYTLMDAVKADYVQRNQSALQGKIGEKIASENITVYDDGLLEGGLRTWKFDGEGVPQQKTLIIEKGVLRNFIYDNYAAKKEGKESTGNAFRGGYLSTPNVEATNFHLAPGKKSPEELIGEIDDGLLVYSLQGAHSSNPASGEFSVVATPAWKIVNGKITRAVKGAMLAGNVFDVIKKISALANNERKIGQLVAPWVIVENVKVIGR